MEDNNHVIAESLINNLIKNGYSLREIYDIIIISIKSKEIKDDIKNYRNHLFTKAEYRKLIREKIKLLKKIKNDLFIDDINLLEEEFNKVEAYRKTLKRL